MHDIHGLAAHFRHNTLGSSAHRLAQNGERTHRCRRALPNEPHTEHRAHQCHVPPHLLPQCIESFLCQRMVAEGKCKPTNMPSTLKYGTPRLLPLRKFERTRSRRFCEMPPCKISISCPDRPFRPVAPVGTEKTGCLTQLQTVRSHTARPTANKSRRTV